MTSAVAEARRQHLLQILRAAPGPLSTSELWESCPDEIVRENNVGRCACQSEWDRVRQRVVRCEHGWYEMAVRPNYTSVYANLRQLERKGFIESIRLADVRSVYWQAVLSKDEAYRIGAEIEQLERMWNRT
jgi:hypothetical protein